MKTELEKILSVSGKPGIYKLLAGGKSTVVVESLVDGKRMPVHPTQKVSSLSDISIFTLDADMPLKEVLTKAKEAFANGPAPEGKNDAKVLHEAMLKVLPNYDRERVYTSDIKKLFQWYNILQSKNMLEFADAAEVGEEKKD